MPRSSWEPWGLFRKPIEARVQDNLRKWKTGALRRPSPSEPFRDLIQSSPTPARGAGVSAPSLVETPAFHPADHACFPSSWRRGHPRPFHGRRFDNRSRRRPGTAQHRIGNQRGFLQLGHEGDSCSACSGLTGMVRSADFDTGVPLPSGLTVQALSRAIEYVERELADLIDIYFEQANVFSALVGMYGAKALDSFSVYEKSKHTDIAQQRFPDLKRRGSPDPLTSRTIPRIKGQQASLGTPSTLRPSRLVYRLALPSRPHDVVRTELPTHRLASRTSHS